MLLRLPLEIGDLFSEWLQANCPDRAKRVLSLMRSTRGGKLYDAKWGERMTGDGPYAWMIGRRFELAAERLGFNKRSVELRTDLFTPAVPSRPATPAVLAVFPQAAGAALPNTLPNARALRESPGHGTSRRKAAAPRAELRSRSGDDGPVSRARRRHRRGGTRALGGTGGGRRGHSQSRPHPRRSQRFETAHARGARGSLSRRSWPPRSSRW